MKETLRYFPKPLECLSFENIGRKANYNTMHYIF